MTAFCKMCKGLLMCWVIHIVVSAEDITVSINSELVSEASNSKTTSEKSKLPVLSTTNKDTQNNEISSPQDITQLSTRPVSTSNKMEVDADPKTKEDGLGAKGEKEEDPLDEVYRECKGRLSCIEQRVVTLIDRVDTVKSIPMFDGYVTIEKTSEEVPETAVTANPRMALLSRVNRYLRSHSIRVHVPEREALVPQVFGQKRSLDFNLGTLATNDASEGRGRLKRLFLPLILFMALNFSLLTPIAIAVVTLLAFKGLWAGLSALMVTAVLGLKALFSSGDGHRSPSTRFSLGFVRPHIIPEIYHSDYLGWSRTVPLPADHPYRTEPYYRGEHAYRGYYPATWDRPAAAAVVAK